MVALVHDDVPVICDQFSDILSTYKGLQHRDIQVSVGLEFATTDLPDFTRFQVQEQRELRSPLIEQRRPVNENQRIARPLRDDFDADNGLARPGRCDEYSGLMSQ